MNVSDKKLMQIIKEELQRNSNRKVLEASIRQISEKHKLKLDEDEVKKIVELFLEKGNLYRKKG